MFIEFDVLVPSSQLNMTVLCPPPPTTQYLQVWCAHVH
jgi:hypothetical protein